MIHSHHHQRLIRSFPPEVERRIYDFIPKENRYSLANALGMSMSRHDALMEPGMLERYIHKAMQTNNITALEFLTNSVIMRPIAEDKRFPAFAQGCSNSSIDALQWWMRNPQIVGPVNTISHNEVINSIMDDMSLSDEDAEAAVDHYNEHVVPLGSVHELVQEAAQDGKLTVLSWFKATFENILKNVEPGDVLNAASLDWLKANMDNFDEMYHEETIDVPCSEGRIDILDWWLANVNPLLYSTEAADWASRNGHVSVLNWLKKNTRPFLYHSAVQLASIFGQIDVLRWFYDEGLELTHGFEITDEMGEKNKYDNSDVILDFWLMVAKTRPHTEPIQIDSSMIDDATRSGNIKMLMWFNNKRIRMPHSERRFMQFKLQGGPEVINFWDNLYWENLGRTRKRTRLIREESRRHMQSDDETIASQFFFVQD